ncbi:MAG: thioesterase family protein [Deltaproteobacteria bacterium]|jgi:fluoroacetyl-CoA thioesterase|nr:thioesterase family protein [Deltaproteobacteria bacterium]MBW2477953.1 thioesterase family protein [Deltaproteobacteria bacterium]MBW2519768.1 thioesterase family protein [Deltaproteobacteria bacterium]
MKPTLKAGMKFVHRYRVPEKKTVPFVYEESHLFQDMPHVFATAFMVGLMEWACMEALCDHIEDNEITLGTHICVSHSAPTPPGMEVEVSVTCTEVDGPRTSWSVVARDEIAEIGSGTHERYAINKEKFQKIVAKKMPV